MISIIITTYREKITLPIAIQAVIDQNLKDYEILVVGPDQDTEEATKEFGQKYSEVKYLKDMGVGKPAALNLAFKQAGGEILVLTDGDVCVEEGSLKYLLKPFSDKGGSASGGGKDLKIGAVSGHPVSINPRNNLFGYWSHFLTEAAHRIRLRKKGVGEYLDCSGYLYAIRNVIQEIPSETLVEDSIVSQIIWRQGFKIDYSPEAAVYVKYPDNFQDWLKQKIRATGGYIQPTNYEFKRITNKRMRGFWQEIGDGLKLFFTYPKSLKEFWWTILLYLARLYLWFLIFWQIKIRRQKIGEIWQRIESTK